MDFDINKLTLIDVISEKHSELRRIAELRWEEISDIHFSHTEWHLLSKIHQESLSISTAAKILGISRQAMQKCAKNLEERGFILSTFHDGNSRDKFLHLTDKGGECCVKNTLLKEQLEKEIADKIGSERVEAMKEWLNEVYIK